MVINENNIAAWKLVAESLDLYEGDLVLFICDNFVVNKEMGKHVGDIDVQGILDRRESDWFWDGPIHTNQRGNAEIAKVLVREYLLEYLRDDSSSGEELKLFQLGKCYLPADAELELAAYVDKVKEDEIHGKDIGAIVMNCNPMTKGHQYLIEKATEQVDFLYIFLVEEDKSDIPFADRFAIAEAVAEKYGNVKVVPSGKFVLSYDTMPIYFEKVQRQEEVLDAGRDLKIFGGKIAPKLGITVRFVGEEPNDKITYQYNESMKALLPAYGIKLVEIPRMTIGGTVVSASEVRRYMNEGNWANVKELVPEEALIWLDKLRRRQTL